MFGLDFNDTQTPANTFPTTPQFILFEVLQLWRWVFYDLTPL